MTSANGDEVFSPLDEGLLINRCFFFFPDLCNGRGAGGGNCRKDAQDKEEIIPFFHVFGSFMMRFNGRA